MARGFRNIVFVVKSTVSTVGGGFLIVAPSYIDTEGFGI